MAAVVTTREIADSLPEYMSTVSLLSKCFIYLEQQLLATLFQSIFSTVATLWRAPLVKQFWKLLSTKN